MCINTSYCTFPFLCSGTQFLFCFFSFCEFGLFNSLFQSYIVLPSSGNVTAEPIIYRTYVIFEESFQHVCVRFVSIFVIFQLVVVILCLCLFFSWLWPSWFTKIQYNFLWRFNLPLQDLLFIFEEVSWKEVCNSGIF